MKVIMFERQFVEPILSGVKRNTIRPIGKRPPVAGEQRSLRYWSGRPYGSRQIEFARVTLNIVQHVTIEEACIVLQGHRYTAILNFLAIRDGFADWAAMRQWFRDRHSLPFSGLMQSWNGITKIPQETA